MVESEKCVYHYFKFEKQCEIKYLPSHNYFESALEYDYHYQIGVKANNLQFHSNVSYGCRLFHPRPYLMIEELERPLLPCQYHQTLHICWQRNHSSECIALYTAVTCFLPASWYELIRNQHPNHMTSLHHCHHHTPPQCPDAFFPGSSSLKSLEVFPYLWFEWRP